MFCHHDVRGDSTLLAGLQIRCESLSGQHAKTAKKEKKKEKEKNQLPAINEPIFWNTQIKPIVDDSAFVWGWLVRMHDQARKGDFRSFNKLSLYFTVSFRFPYSKIIPLDSERGTSFVCLFWRFADFFLPRVWTLSLRTAYLHRPSRWNFLRPERKPADTTQGWEKLCTFPPG